jgi:hypothetical protein
MTTTQSNRAEEVRKPGKQVQVVSGEYRGMVGRTIGPIGELMVNVFVFDASKYVTVFAVDVDVAETERTVAAPMPQTVTISGTCICGDEIRATFDQTTGGMHEWYHVGEASGRIDCPR